MTIDVPRCLILHSSALAQDAQERVAHNLCRCRVLFPCLMVTVNIFRYVLPADEYCFGDDLQTTRFFLALRDDATYVQKKHICVFMWYSAEVNVVVSAVSVIPDRRQTSAGRD